jgi:two-component system OmpR family sensor kinase
VIVTDGMQVVVYDTTQRLAATARAVVVEAVTESDRLAADQGLTGQARVSAANAELLGRLPELLSHAGSGAAEYALYDASLRPVFSSSEQALAPAQQADRLKAQSTGVSRRSLTTRGDLLSGLVNRAQLGVAVVHMPLQLPSGGTGVLDVTYQPVTEEQAIDAIRTPMTVLALSAMLIMVILMQTSMVWVLNLVDDLRKAADSIDAGRLDERLPDSGRNEIGALARSINSLIERLQRRSEAQSRFVADASHELATPVAGIRGYTSILRAWGAEDPIVRDEAVDAIDRESRRMARLTGDLLNLLHADQALTLKSERFDVNGVVRDRLAATASRWIDKDIEFVGPSEGQLLMVGDADRVEDVVSILLDNAAKYTGPHGRVTVTTGRRRETVVVEVIDTGQGIPPEDMSRLFDRFYRSEASRAAGEGGFGLGLAIAKTIVENMGGEISVRSRVGEGTTFTVEMPRGRA